MLYLHSCPSRKTSNDVADSVYTTSKQLATLARQCTKLARAAVKIRSAQRVYSPAATSRYEAWEAIKENTSSTIEARPLLLPSALTEAEHASCVGNVVEIEQQLCNAQCRAALAHVRDQLLGMARDLRFNNTNTHHQGSTTHARTLLKGTDAKIKMYAEKYIAVRLALLALNNHDATKVPWCELNPNRNLRCMEEGEYARARGGSGEAADAAGASHIQCLRNATGEGW
ncbi:hypothetical protein GGG16DRAFT_116702 [Schizophyllum commune]